MPLLSGRGPWAPSLSIAPSVWDSLIHLPKCICLQAIGTFNNSGEAECVALSPHKAGSEGACPQVGTKDKEWPPRSPAQWQGPGSGSRPRARALALVPPGPTPRTPGTQPLCSGQMPRPPAAPYPPPPLCSPGTPKRRVSSRWSLVLMGAWTPEGPRGGRGSPTFPSARL